MFTVPAHSPTHQYKIDFHMLKVMELKKKTLVFRTHGDLTRAIFRYYSESHHCDLALWLG